LAAGFALVVGVPCGFGGLVTGLAWRAASAVRLSAGFLLFGTVRILLGRGAELAFCPLAGIVWLGADFAGGGFAAGGFTVSDLPDANFAGADDVLLAVGAANGADATAGLLARAVDLGVAAFECGFCFTFAIRSSPSSQAPWRRVSRLPHTNAPVFKCLSFQVKLSFAKA
jgi:hypothetical protein